MTDETDHNKAREQVDAIGAAMGLTAAVSELSNQVKEVDTRGKHNKRLTRIVIFSLVLDILLTVGIGLVGYNTHFLTNQLRQANFNSCGYSNVVRGDDIKLWDEAVAIISPKGTAATPASEKAEANFLKYIDSTFKSVNCSSLVNGNPVK